RLHGQDSNVTVRSGPSWVTGIGEAKISPQGFPGGRRVRGKDTAGRSECGSGHTETRCGASLTERSIAVRVRAVEEQLAGALLLSRMIKSGPSASRSRAALPSGAS